MISGIAWIVIAVATYQIASAMVSAFRERSQTSLYDVYRARDQLIWLILTYPKQQGSILPVYHLVNRNVANVRSFRLTQFESTMTKIDDLLIKTRTIHERTKKAISPNNLDIEIVECALQALESLQSAAQRANFLLWMLVGLLGPPVDLALRVFSVPTEAILRRRKITGDIRILEHSVRHRLAA